MYSAYKLNKQDDNIQPWCTPFPIWNQSVVPCPVLAVASGPANRSLKRQCQVVWYFHLFQNFPQFIVIHTVKGFGIVNEAEIDVFLEISCFFDHLADVGNLISGCSVFSKIQLEHLEVHGSHIAEAWLGEFWALHYIYIIISVWDEFNCVLVWAFFGIAFLCDWNENWPFPVSWPLLSFAKLLTYWV